METPHLRSTVQRLMHAYAQAPWRTQRQRIGALLLPALGLAMVATLYLDVTSQAAIAGRQIQEVTRQSLAIQQANADLESKLAELTSTSAMQERAQAAGFEPVDASQLEYVGVAGYAEPKPEILTGASALRPRAPSIPPEYTESLIAWLSHRLGALQTPAGDVAGASQ